MRTLNELQMRSQIVNEHLRNAQTHKTKDKWDDEKHESAQLKLEEKIKRMEGKNK